MTDAKQKGTELPEPPFFSWLDKVYRDKHFGLPLLITGVLSVGFGVLAYSFPETPFWGHFLTELAVAGLVIVATVIFVEQLLEHRRKVERAREWAQVRRTTIQALLMHLDVVSHSTIRAFFAFSEEAGKVFLDPFKKNSEEATGWLPDENVPPDAPLEDFVSKGSLPTKAKYKIITIAGGLLRGEATMPGVELRLDRAESWAKLMEPLVSDLRQSVLPTLLQCSPDRDLLSFVLTYNLILSYMAMCMNVPQECGVPKRDGFVRIQGAAFMLIASILRHLGENYMKAGPWHFEELERLSQKKTGE